MHAPPALLGDSTLRLCQAALILVLLLKRAQVHIPCCWVSPLLRNTPGSSHSFLFLKYRYRLHCREQSKPRGSDTGWHRVVALFYFLNILHSSWVGLTPIILKPVSGGVKFGEVCKMDLHAYVMKKQVFRFIFQKTAEKVRKRPHTIL